MEKTCELSWSPRARRDLRCLDCHVPHFDERALDELKDGIFQRVEFLKSFPKLGRPLRKMGDDWRQLVFRPFRIIYFVDNASHTVFISRVWHASRAEPTEEDLIPLR